MNNNVSVLFFRVSLFMCQCHKGHNFRKFKLVLLENWKRNSVVSMLSSLVIEKFCPNQQGKPVLKTSRNVQGGSYIFMF